MPLSRGFVSPALRTDFTRLNVAYGLVTATFRLPVLLDVGSMKTVYVPVVGSVCCVKLKFVRPEMPVVIVVPSGRKSFTLTEGIVFPVMRTVTA
jgi:hypothetical protein